MGHSCLDLLFRAWSLLLLEPLTLWGLVQVSFDVSRPKALSSHCAIRFHLCAQIPDDFTSRQSPLPVPEATLLRPSAILNAILRKIDWVLPFYWALGCLGINFPFCVVKLVLKSVIGILHGTQSYWFDKNCMWRAKFKKTTEYGTAKMLSSYREPR